MRDTEPNAVLECPFGKFLLQRWPESVNDKLRAWDAADEYLLKHVSEQVHSACRVLVVNDVHGALSTALHAWQPVSWSDSAVSFRALVENCKRNQIDSAPVTVPSTETPSGTYDLVLIRIPKTTSLLNDQLAKLRQLVRADTRIVAAGMVKHLQKSAFVALETYIGSVTTSLAVKKARLVFPMFNESLEVKPPATSITYTDPDLGFALENLPNVFSQDRLDHGARFFMSQFSKLPDVKRIVDLGCGNGVLGIYWQKDRANSVVTFIDESYAAVASAQRNHQRLFDSSNQKNSEATFIAACVLDGLADESIDLILCNPPFHQQHVVGQQVALSMFADSKRVLCKGGQLWIVANRHLDYAAPLKRMFGNCTSIATNNKFRVLNVVKR